MHPAGLTLSLSLSLSSPSVYYLSFLLPFLCLFSLSSSSPLSVYSLSLLLLPPLSLSILSQGPHGTPGPAGLNGKLGKRVRLLSELCDIVVMLQIPNSGL